MGRQKIHPRLQQTNHVYSTLHYKEDIISEENRRKLKISVASTFPAVDLIMRFTTRGYSQTNKRSN